MKLCKCGHGRADHRFLEVNGEVYEGGYCDLCGCMGYNEEE